MKKRPAYLFDEKLVKLAEKVGDNIRKREKEDLEYKLRNLKV